MFLCVILGVEPAQNQLRVLIDHIEPWIEAL